MGWCQAFGTWKTHRYQAKGIPYRPHTSHNEGPMGERGMLWQTWALLCCAAPDVAPPYLHGISGASKMPCITYVSLYVIVQGYVSLTRHKLQGQELHRA